MLVLGRPGPARGLFPKPGPVLGRADPKRPGPSSGRAFLGPAWDRAGPSSGRGLLARAGPSQKARGLARAF